MKRRHYKYWLFTLIIIVITSIILFTQRKRALDYENLLANGQYDLRNPVTTVEMIIGEVNDYDKFNDYYIEDYDDLYKYSQEILLVKVNKSEAVGNSIYAYCSVEKVIKSANELSEEDNIIIAQMVELRANVSDKNDYHIDESKPVRLLMYSPIVDMKKDKEYIVFLNKMEGIDNLYRQSSSLYGIVPFKEKINILLIDIKEDGYKIDVNDNYDYIARINESYNLDYVINQSKKEKAISLANNYWLRYQKICQFALKEFEIEASFSVED